MGRACKLHFRATRRQQKNTPRLKAKSRYLIGTPLMNQPSANPSAADLAFFRFQQKANRAFVTTANSYALEECKLMDMFEQADFDRRLEALPNHFLDFSEVDPRNYADPEAAVTFGLFAALDNPDVEAAVGMIVDSILVFPPKEVVNQELERLGVPVGKLQKLAAANWPGAVEVEYDAFGEVPTGELQFECPAHYADPTHPGLSHGVEVA